MDTFQHPGGVENQVGSRCGALYATTHVCDLMGSLHQSAAARWAVAQSPRARCSHGCSCSCFNLRSRFPALPCACCRAWVAESSTGSIIRSLMRLPACICSQLQPHEQLRGSRPPRHQQQAAVQQHSSALLQQVRPGLARPPACTTWSVMCPARHAAHPTRRSLAHNSVQKGGNNKPLFWPVFCFAARAPPPLLATTTSAADLPVHLFCSTYLVCCPSLCGLVVVPTPVHSWWCWRPHQPFSPHAAHGRDWWCHVWRGMGTAAAPAAVPPPAAAVAADGCGGGPLRQCQSGSL